MDRSKIEKIINEIDDISQKNYDDDFNLAMYIYIRYGKFEFDNYICNDELEKVNEVLKRYDSIFNEDLNDETRLILNDDEDDEED